MGTLQRAARLAVVLPVLAVLAACGTTTPQTTTVGSDAGGNSQISQGGADTPGSTGADADGPSAPASAAATTAGGAGDAAGSAPGSLAAPAPGMTSAPVAVESAAPGGSRSKRPPAGTPEKATATPGGAKGASPAPSKSSTSATAAAASAAPLKIGFDYFDAASSQAANAAAGVTATTNVTAIGVFDALVKYFNTHGGLGGRQVTVVPHSENDMSTNFATDAQSACQYFTQDSPVPIVVDSAWGAGYGYNSCLTKAGVEDISLPQPPDAASLSADPFQVYPVNITPDRAYPAALVQLVKAGILKSGTKIGVFMDKCPTTTAAYASTILPEFKTLGLVPDPFSTTCIAGYGGLGQASTDASAAVLQFRADGDTQVMMISANDSTYWVLYGAVAASQQYNTGLIMTSYSQATAEEGSFTATQKSDIHGAGWVPLLDTDNPKVPGSSVEASCDAMSTAGGEAPQVNNDHYYVYTLCAPLLLLKAALAADGSDAGAGALSKVIPTLGTSLSIPGILGGSADFSRQDAPAETQLFGYSASCSCIAYSGSPTPV